MIENGYKCHSLIIKVRTKAVNVVKDDTEGNTSGIKKYCMRYEYMNVR